MHTENPSVVIWQDGAPVLWRAGSLEAEPVSDETLFPSGVIIGLPSDDVRTTLLEVSADEQKHLASSLPYMMEEQVANDVDELHYSHQGNDLCQRSRSNQRSFVTVTYLSAQSMKK